MARSRRPFRPAASLLARSFRFPPNLPFECDREGKSRREGRKEKASGTRGTTIPARHNFSFSDLPTGGINPIGSQRVVSQKINGCLLMLPRPLWLTTSASLLRFNYFLSKKGIERLSVPINEERSEEEEENSFLLFSPSFFFAF